VENVGNPTTAQRSSRTTPTKLRIWTVAVLALAATALVTMTTAVADTQRGIHRVGREAAPQAQVTSDLYFALSDLDAQTARTILTNGKDDLVSAQLDAQLTFNQRLADVDSDLRRAVGGAGAADQDVQGALQKMLDDVARYHELAASAQWLDTAAQWLDPASQDAQTGKTATAARSFYSQATDLLHFELLPAAGTLRDAYAEQLTQATNDEQDAATRGEILVLVAGLALLAALIAFQLVLRGRFRRSLNPFLAVASVGTAVLLVAGLAMNSQQSDRLQTAVSRHMDPYLGIQHARAVAYDATGAVIRYAVAPKFGYEKGFAADAGQLRTPDGKGLLASGLTGSDPALARTADSDWRAVAADADKVMRAVDQGDVETALKTATGIARGQVAMDFYALDVHLGQAATAQREAFDRGLADARSGASGWAGLPAVVLGLVMALTLAGVRARLAEYR
jgi:hypothetical protein